MNGVPPQAKRVALALQQLAQTDRLELVLRMTLIVLLFGTKDIWIIRVPITSLCFAAIFHPPLYRNPRFWLAATVVQVLGNAIVWYTIENHHYLITYWCLALYFALLSRDPEQSVALNGRLLIGLAFLFATVWKAISNDYLDGTFFHYTLLSDRRFTGMAQLVGGLTSQASLQNSQALAELTQPGATLVHVQLHDTVRIRWIAQFFTWWTIGIEGCVAAAFLWRPGTLLSKWRDVPLLVFLFTTYALAPVPSFGWTLVTLGVSQTATSSKVARILYIVAFLVIELYLIPWQTYIQYVI